MERSHFSEKYWEETRRVRRERVWEELPSAACLLRHSLPSLSFLLAIRCLMLFRKSWKIARKKREKRWSKKRLAKRNAHALRWTYCFQEISGPPGFQPGLSAPTRVTPRFLEGNPSWRVRHPRTMKIANPPSPPFSKRGVGGGESYFLSD